MNKSPPTSDRTTRKDTPGAVAAVTIWLPIESYDKLKIKPKFAVFYVEEQLGRNCLNAMISTTRSFGFRTITHWILLPDTP